MKIVSYHSIFVEKMANLAVAMVVANASQKSYNTLQTYCKFIFLCNIFETLRTARIPAKY